MTTTTAAPNPDLAPEPQEEKVTLGSIFRDYRIADAERDPVAPESGESLGSESLGTAHPEGIDRACTLPVASSWRNGPAEKLESAC